MTISQPPPADVPLKRQAQSVSGLFAEGVSIGVLLLVLGAALGGLLGIILFLHTSLATRLDKVEARLLAVEIEQARSTAVVEAKLSELSRQMAELTQAVKAK